MSRRKVCVVVGSRANYSSIKSAMRAISAHPALELQIVVGASALLDRYGAVVTLIEKDGRRHDVALEPLLCFRMKGIGYSHPSWGHGMWKGELAVGGESWKTDDLDEMAIENQHIQQVVRATSGGNQGIGVLEQIAFGPHHRYGFKELLDPAR